jgi:hypothetical protein
VRLRFIFPTGIRSVLCGDPKMVQAMFSV